LRAEIKIRVLLTGIELIAQSVTLKCEKKSEPIPFRQLHVNFSLEPDPMLHVRCNVLVAVYRSGR